MPIFLLLTNINGINYAQLLFHNLLKGLHCQSAGSEHPSSLVIHRSASDQGFVCVPILKKLSLFCVPFSSLFFKKNLLLKQSCNRHK